MDENVTIKQIAQMAGVHRSTVDKVLHNRPGVSPKVRLRIKEIIETMDYKPNAIGKALKYQEKRQTIAAVLLHVSSKNEITQGIIRAQKEFGMFGYEVEFHFTEFHDVDGQVRLMEMLLERDVAGLIVQPLFSSKVSAVFNKLKNKGVPVVIINTDLPDSEHLCYVGQNYRVAAHTAARLTKEFLHDQGKIVIINGSYNLLHTIYERSNEYVKYLRKISPQMEIVEIVDSGESEAKMYESTFEVLGRRKDIDCFYVTSGGVGGVGQAIKAAGLAGKTKIICYDLYPEVINLIKEGIIVATICQGLGEQGYQSFKIAFRYLFYGELPEVRNVFNQVDIRLLENISSLCD